MPAPIFMHHAEPARVTRPPFERSTPLPIDLDTLAAMIGRQVHPHDTLIVGFAGSAAAGQSTLCRALSGRLDASCDVEIMSTDSFLLTNDPLAQRSAAGRMNYPDSRDAARLSGALQRVRFGPVLVPGYSHVARAPDAALDRIIDRPQLLLVEGPGLSPYMGRRHSSNLIDLLVYIDGSEDDLAAPNLREHIASARDRADILLRKGADHGLSLLRPSRASLQLTPAV